jgi:hypothetical protein
MNNTPTSFSFLMTTYIAKKKKLKNKSTKIKFFFQIFNNQNLTWFKRNHKNIDGV